MRGYSIPSLIPVRCQTSQKVSARSEPRARASGEPHLKSPNCPRPADNQARQNQTRRLGNDGDAEGIRDIVIGPEQYRVKVVGIVRVVVQIARIRVAKTYRTIWRPE